jgi:hypothetical protein
MNLVVGSVYGGFRGLPLPPIDPERVIWFEPLQTTAVVRSPKTAGAGYLRSITCIGGRGQVRFRGPPPRSAPSVTKDGHSRDHGHQ